MPTPTTPPWRHLVSDPKHGPLPALLLALTVVTGLVDAVSILSLGRVFVANMTGNVVFIGFALAHAPGFSLAASLSALGGFLVGAYIGGRLIARSRGNRRTLLLDSALTELLFFAVAAVVAQVSGVPYRGSVQDAVAAVAAVAMGIQNASSRRLAVPDITTTVLTMTLTGLAAELRNGNQPALLRRVLAVATMLGGAIVGAVLTLHVRPSAALEAATGVLLAVTLVTAVSTRTSAPWAKA